MCVESYEGLNQGIRTLETKWKSGQNLRRYSDQKVNEVLDFFNRRKSSDVRREGVFYVDAGAADKYASSTDRSDSIKNPLKLARDMLQVVQDTLGYKKSEEETVKLCPIATLEDDLSSENDGIDTRIESRISSIVDFFYTMVKPPQDCQKQRRASCFKGESTSSEDSSKPYSKPDDPCTEQKMETLMEFLTSAGCIDNHPSPKITLMEFLFGDQKIMKSVSDYDLGHSIDLSDITYIDETPTDPNRNILVDIILKYMEEYEAHENVERTDSMTPLDRSKSDLTISKLTCLTVINKAKSENSISRATDDFFGDDSPGRRTIIEDKPDFTFEAADEPIDHDTVTEIKTLLETDFLAYPQLEDIIEVDEDSSRLELSKVDAPQTPSPDERTRLERIIELRACAEQILNDIQRNLTQYNDDTYNKLRHQSEATDSVIDSATISRMGSVDEGSSQDMTRSNSDSDSVFSQHQTVCSQNQNKPSTEDKATTTSDCDSFSEKSTKVDSSCNTDDDRSTSSSERSCDKILEKIDSLHRFFIRTRLEMIEEDDDELPERRRNHRFGSDHSSKSVSNPESTERTESKTDQAQASLDDVEEIEDNEIIADDCLLDQETDV